MNNPIPAERLAELPAWPAPLPQLSVTPENIVGSVTTLFNYEHARAEAAIARLRVAVEALKRNAASYGASDHICSRRGVADNALATIGEIPE